MPRKNRPDKSQPRKPRKPRDPLVRAYMERDGVTEKDARNLAKAVREILK